MDVLVDDEDKPNLLQLNNPSPPPPSDFYIDSASSTPYVSAPSSPTRPFSHPQPSFFYSCPSSPMHFSPLSISSSSSTPQYQGEAYEFEFPGGLSSSGSGRPGSMSSADELFLDGKIRPMKLSTHLERPQALDIENEEEEEDKGDNFSEERRGRVRSGKSRSRRTRSMSPLRSSSFGFLDVKIESFLDGSCKGRNFRSGEGGFDKIEEEETSGGMETTSRSSSAGRSSKRWVFLKDFLYRSKSEGRSNHKFWSNISFSPGKERKSVTLGSSGEKVGSFLKEKGNGSNGGKKLVNGGVVGKRRVPTTIVSPHELHYKASRAQAEEMRKRTFLPYRQGLFGCLGFSSKGYGAMNGFARALNPVSSR